MTAILGSRDIPGSCWGLVAEKETVGDRGESSEDTRVEVKSMPGDFGKVTTIIGLVINFLAFGTPFITLRDTLSYILELLKLE